MTKDSLSVVRATFEAYKKRDRAQIELLIAEDFHFTSPLDNRLDRASYFERCWPNSETIAGFDFIHLVEGNGRVFVTYEGQSTNGRRFRNCEIHEVRDGRIVEVEVYFGWSIPHKAIAGGFVDAPDVTAS